ncbi:MAG: hypothetical protein AAF940_14775 [Pseudomonadota bacterium]
MTNQRYSDAALLKGDYAHLASDLKDSQRGLPSKEDWQRAACNEHNRAEMAAQAVAKQIFNLQQQIDRDTEQLEIATISAAGPMIVSGVFPEDGDMLRVDGHLIADKRPVALLIHAHQLALTITKSTTAQTNPEDDGLKIGFVIFDELEKRAEARQKARAKSEPKPSPKKAKSK